MLKLLLTLKLVVLVMVVTLVKFISTLTTLDLLEDHASNMSLTTFNMRSSLSMNAKIAHGLHLLLGNMVKTNAGLSQTLDTTSVITTALEEPTK